MKKLLFVLCTLMPAIALADSDMSADTLRIIPPKSIMAEKLQSLKTIRSLILLDKSSNNNQHKLIIFTRVSLNDREALFRFS